MGYLNPALNNPALDTVLTPGLDDFDVFVTNQ